MSLISVMYHHLNSDRCSNEYAIFEEHLRYIKRNFTPVTPGDEIKGKSICLTFDDAYADFYHLTYPLLKKYDIKALLGVPSKYILEDCNAPKEERMGIKHSELFANYQKGTFCTFKELEEMTHSGLVKIASHSHSHSVLSQDGVDFAYELRVSKEILEKRLGIAVDSFIFPYGKYNKAIMQEAQRYYRYIFRIGNALQRDFTGIRDVIYRVNGDGLKYADEIFRFHNTLKYSIKRMIRKVFS